MALIDEVKKLCSRLGPAGWERLFARHGLDIRNPDLAAELARPLASINRSLAGFEDFAAEATRGVEPGVPARSLLYHAFASLNVQSSPELPLTEFPSPRELEVLENYVFAAWRPSLSELTGIAGDRLMAVVAFSCEYRPGVDTVHRKHADLCFSRTGVSRVGTGPAHYDRDARGYKPRASSDEKHVIRVLPARYSAWIALQSKGKPNRFGPMRASSDDAQRDFWVPIHKLFDGTECIEGLELDVAFVAHHVNEKLRRVHLEFSRRGFNGGWSAPQIDQPPFRFSEGIAELSTKSSDGSGLLVPVPHEAMVAPAQRNGEDVTFTVPTEQAIRSRSSFLPTLEITAERNVRLAPEYVHVRTVPGAAVENLNEVDDPVAKVKQAGYRALHYVDFTGDGWVEVECAALRPVLPRFIPAYSIVSAPDFFFNTDQRELMEWWKQKAPAKLRDFLWGTPPDTLSDQRFPPNLKLNNVDFRPGDASVPLAGFREEDETATSIVALEPPSRPKKRPLPVAKRDRHNMLPDGAAGVFAPGWDVSLSRTGSVEHLAAYGLGSPFPEDAKLCAALSSFWPSASPDTGRSFSEVFPTVAPLTDAEIGSDGNLPWDGVRGPRVVAGSEDVVEYASFERVDYVLNALSNKFSMALVGSISAAQYVARVLAMARAYRAVGVQSVSQKTEWRVLSFTLAKPSDADVSAAFSATNETLSGDLFRIKLFQEDALPKPDKMHERFRMRDPRTLLVGGNAQVLMQANGAWTVLHV
ncbi:MAG: hypothetical protein QM756_44590 [Polyangiaceae bacterium]